MLEEAAAIQVALVVGAVVEVGDVEEEDVEVAVEDRLVEGEEAVELLHHYALVTLSHLLLKKLLVRLLPRQSIPLRRLKDVELEVVVEEKVVVELVEAEGAVQG